MAADAKAEARAPMTGTEGEAMAVATPESRVRRTVERTARRTEARYLTRAPAENLQRVSTRQ